MKPHSFIIPPPPHGPCNGRKRQGRIKRGLERRLVKREANRRERDYRDTTIYISTGR